MSHATASAPDWFARATDMHVHSSPSLFPRLYDDFELARHAAEAGMAGVVIKAHEGSTVERALLVDAQVAEVKVYGGIVLNHFVGGFNPYAVELALALGGRVVWMPTMHASHHLAHYGGASYREQQARHETRTPEPLVALDETGRLRRDVRDVLEVVATHGAAVLSNGHLSAEETLALFREAKRLGVERLLVAHPLLPLTDFSLEVQRELAELGALIEHCYLPHLPRWGGVPFERVVAHVREVGPERCVLSTDLGQTTSPPPAEGLLAFGEALLAGGLSERDLRRMLVANPAALLDT